MVYDSARGRVVLFGGQIANVGDLGDTWELDGSRWIERTPAVSPPARATHAMAYDSARGRVVLFGGRSTALGDLGDTWEWDGSQWTERTPAVSPPARDSLAMAYDSARGRVVLFGGDGAPFPFGDTWEWDGSQWIQRTPASAPAPRSGHAMAYDSVRGRVVLFGGGYNLADTWEWDGSEWAERISMVTPPAVSGHSLAYDGARGRVVLFGGWGPPPGVRPPGASVVIGCSGGETWEWDGAVWIQRTPAVSPPARCWQAMAYDGARGRVILFGGSSLYFGDLADTWEWDGDQWTQGLPLPRHAHALAFDSARGRTVMFGGSSSIGDLADTWEWDGSRWTRRTPAVGPSARVDHAMAYDSVRGRVVLFGGYATGVGNLGDTWEWDGSQWQLRTPAVSPPAGSGHAMVFDSARGRVALFAGITWEWDGSQWTERAPDGPPWGRYRPAMAYDSQRRRVVLFGGGGPFEIQYGDTWELDGSQWTQRAPAVSPPAVPPAMAYDSARGRVVLVGGWGLADTWEWDGSQWVQRTPATSPPPRWGGHAMAYDSLRGRVVLFGGSNGYNSYLGDTWEYSECGYASGSSPYGRLLFPPLCTGDAAGLTEDVYDGGQVAIPRGAHDSFYLSSSGTSFTPLVVDDAVRINGQDSGLGPYERQAGVPPFTPNVPIEHNLIPLPAHDVTDLIPPGTSIVTFELLDTDRGIYGHTAVYLVADCGIWLAGNSPTTINWITHDDQIAGTPPEFDAQYGLLSQLKADRNYSGAACLGHFNDTPATDALPNPAVGDGYYYLVRGVSSCMAQGYGDSSLVPDPRDALDVLPICP